MPRDPAMESVPIAQTRERWERGFALALILLTTSPLAGQDPVVPTERPTGIERPDPDRLRVRKLGEGVFQIGEVRIVQSNRSAIFPGRVNQTNGLVEYFLVTGYGPTHESVLQTEAEPLQVHLAMLALGAKDGTNAANARGSRSFPAGATHLGDGLAKPDATTGAADGPATGGGPITEPIHELIPGDPVILEISWQVEAGIVRRRAEELIWNAQTGAAMTSGPWHYNGSMKPAGVLLAQGNGILASVIADRSALINNPRPGRDNDEIWFVRSNALPAVGTPVEIRVALPGRASARP